MAWNTVANGDGVRPKADRLGPEETAVLQPHLMRQIEERRATSMSVKMGWLLLPNWQRHLSDTFGTDGPAPIPARTIVNYPAA